MSIFGVNKQGRYRYLVEDRDHETPCWIWQGGTCGGGYGAAVRTGTRRMMVASRLAYIETHGPIPDEMQVDHLCKQRKCINPEHLEAVTPRVNVLRGDTIVAANARKTHCPQGHPYSEANTYLYGGHRACRTCVIERSRRRHERARATA